MNLLWMTTSCLLLFGASTVVVESREVTNEDIKDILVTVIHLLHDTQDKLERHEMREKHLGEVVKRALGGLDKRHRGLEPIRGMLERLDGRLAGVETVLIKNEERQKTQNSITNETVDNLVTRLDTLSKQMTSSAQSKSTTDASSAACQNVHSEIYDLKQSLTEIKERMNANDAKLTKIDSVSSKVMDIMTEKSSDMAVVLEKYESKLTDLTYREPVALGGSIVDTNNMAGVLERQEQTLKEIRDTVASNQAMLKVLPSVGDVSAITNTTLFSLQQVKFDLFENSNKTLAGINERLTTLGNELLGYHDKTNNSYVELMNMQKMFYTGTTKSYEQLHKEVQSLSKIEKVMVDTAQNILDMKRRVEYGVHQILMEVGDLVKVQSKDLNGTVNKRFDDIELTILDNQSGALANLTAKFETEMSRVWRQIGIMHQQVTASNTALDRLQAQTENYVNGSLNTMDSMGDKVGTINTRMAEVDSNLNYLMGRLSLVTHDFNQIKIGLGKALDEIRGSFIAVQDKVKSVKDQGPGPHQIATDENEIDVDDANRTP